jgi:hypothetical protein
MAELVVQTISLTGNKPVTVQGGLNGDSFVNDGQTYLYVKNTGASSNTVSIESRKQCNQGHYHNISVSIPASEERQIGLFPPDRFNDIGKRIVVTYGLGTNLQVAAIKL